MGKPEQPVHPGRTCASAREASAAGRRSLSVSKPQAFVHHQRLTVSFDYPVYFCRGVFCRQNPTLVTALSQREPERRHRLLAVLDDGVARAWPKLADDICRYVAHHAQTLELAAPPEVVPGGEVAKNEPQIAHNLHTLLHRCAIDRQSFMIAIGGGAVLDMAGYVAATAHRGVRLIRVPTTVLSQDDSGVGVKNGVNGFGAKNYLGAFAPPFAVINDFDFIATLEPRDKIGGMAEAVKIALIRDREFFVWLEENASALGSFDPGATEYLIRACAELHMGHIAGCGDPFETGSARPLDFGHWAAHKLESLSHHALRHGEAVAIGLALDSRYSVERGMLDEAQQLRICRLLETLGFRLWHDAMEIRDAHGDFAVLKGVDEFREHLGGELTVTMLTDLGTGVDVHDIDVPTMLRAAEWLKGWDARRRMSGSDSELRV